MELSSFERAEAALQSHFGYSGFRPGQWEIISSVLEGRNTLAVLPTGGGKSICYQIPALLSSKLTIVVSPLIALMKDQVDALQRARIRATAIHSYIDFRDALNRLENARHGMYDLLYIAPERFESQTFLEHIRHIPVGLLAIDEAHCISEWGHNFRPSYRRLKDAVQYIGSPTVLALTATATPDVRQDIIVQLGMQQSSVIVRGFDRPNLAFKVARDVKKKSYILDVCMKGQPAIVYAGTRKTVEDIASYLQQHGIEAAAYHAGLPDSARQEAQNGFIRNDIRVMAATNAFGMGIDKPDVRFVIHYDMPSTIEQYYQEAGRAGRDGLPAECILLHTSSDRSLPEFFINSSFPDRSLVQEVYASLHQTAGTREGQEYRGVLPLTASTIAAQLSVTNESAVNGALRLLEEQGFIRNINASYNESELRFSVSPDRMRLWLTEGADDAIQPVAIALLRSVGSEAFHYPVRFFIEEIAEKAFFSAEYILSGLQELKKLGIVEYTLGHRASGIALLGPRLSSRGLTIDYRRVDALKKHQYEKLEAVQQYIQSGTCRRNALLEYFDEQTSGRCGRCDNCTAPAVGGTAVDDEERLQRLVLECAAELGGKFGKTTLIDVLRGASTKRIAQYKLYEADTYGAAERTDKTALGRIIDGLIGLGWLAKTDSIHPALHLTETGASKLRRRVRQLNLPQPGTNAREFIRNPELYNSLRTIRRRIASDLNLPSHAILSDAVLVSIANAAPESEPAFLAIEGVGPVTYSRCGKQMLRAIHEWKESRIADTLRASASRQMPALPSSLMPAFKLCQKGMNLTEIAEDLRLTEGTVSGQIADILSQGVALDTSALIPEAHRDEIRRAADSLRTREIRKIKQVLDDGISYAEIRIVIAELDNPVQSGG